MRAIVQDAYGDADVLRFDDIDSPTVGVGDVLVRVHAAGIDAGVWHLMTGLPYLTRLGFGLTRPRHPVRGRDFAGVVEAVGSDVTDLAPGDPVFGTSVRGAFAELVSVPADRVELRAGGSGSGLRLHRAPRPARQRPTHRGSDRPGPRCERRRRFVRRPDRQDSRCGGHRRLQLGEARLRPLPRCRPRRRLLHDRPRRRVDQVRPPAATDLSGRCAAH